MFNELREYFSQQNVGIKFQDLLEKMGFSKEKIYDIATSLQKSNLITEHEKETLANIFSKAPRLEEFHTLSNTEIYFINSLLEKSIGINVLGANNSSKIVGISIAIRCIVFSILGVIFTFMLYMALYEGHSSVPYFHENNIIAIIVVFSLMCALFLLEGTQISLTTLRLKDIDLIDGVRSPVKKLHSEYRSEQNIQKYLAGRQLLTIITVFFISRICSFTELNIIPGFNVEIPNFMSPWFKVVFYDYGILAALVTLWIGQLTPQFWANKQPLKFLSLPLTRFTVALSRIMECIGITDFGGVITDKIKASDPIPISPREMYDTFKVKNGYSATGISVRYSVSDDHIDVDVLEDFLFDRGGITKIHLDEELQGGVINKNTDFEILRGGHQIGRDVSSSTSVAIGDSETTPFILTPHQASFMEGDAVLKKLKFTFSRESCDSRRITINRPIRYLLITIEADTDVELGQPRLQLIDEHKASSSKDFSELFNLERIQATSNKTIFALFLTFPNTEIIYEFSWEKEIL